MTTATDARAYLSKPSAATYLDCSVDTVERLIAEGTLTPRKLRGHVRISKQEIDDYMNGKRRRRRAS